MQVVFPVDPGFVASGRLISSVVGDRVLSPPCSLYRSRPFGRAFPSVLVPVPRLASILTPLLVPVSRFASVLTPVIVPVSRLAPVSIHILVPGLIPLLPCRPGPRDSSIPQVAPTSSSRWPSTIGLRVAELRTEALLIERRPIRIAGTKTGDVLPYGAAYTAPVAARRLVKRRVEIGGTLLEKVAFKKRGKSASLKEARRNCTQP